MNRKQFLARLALGAAAIATGGALAPEARALMLYGDGIHDDTEALQAWFDWEDVIDARTGENVGSWLPSGRRYLISKPVIADRVTKEDDWRAVGPVFDFINGGTIQTKNGWIGYSAAVS